MRILKLDPDQFYTAYGIGCQHVFPWDGISETPFFATWCVVPPGGTARSHMHQEHESFVIVRGRGRMTVNGESREVASGDVVVMPPFSTHELVNASTDEELVFFDLCWEKAAEAAEMNRAAMAGAAAARGAADALVTATPPTPNGNLHVGHLSGPYLGADVFTRYRRMRGRRAAYISGVDDHQSYTEVKAMRDGRSAREVADSFGDAMAMTLRRADIRLDLWARPNRSPHHVEMVQRVFRDLVDRGAIVAREAPTLWCSRCQIHLYEAHATGLCPHCGEGSAANACEACGWPNDGVDLVDPVCRHCGDPASARPLRRFYFPLSPYADRLAAWWAEATMNPHLRSLCEEMLARGLPDIAVSQQTDWGIRVPVEGFERQAIYVWFEMGPGYLAATQELLDREEAGRSWKSVWSAPENETVQFFGFDNGYFHALLFPATFLAWDPEIRLPAAFVTNEFYRYEGKKFSTSRNHAMWGPELLDRISADAARFYLAWDGPEREQSSFTFGECQATVDRELIGGWEAWLKLFSARLAGEFAGVLPGTGAWTEEHQAFYQCLTEVTAEVGTAYEPATFSPRRAVRALSELVRTARAFGLAEEHRRRVPGRFEERRTAVALEALAIKTLSLLSAPVLPGFAARLWAALGFDGPLTWQDVPEFVPSGRRLDDLGRAWFSQASVAATAAVE